MPYKDKEKQRAAQLAYHYRHREAVLERKKKYREKNKEKIREYDREYSRTHRDVRNRLSRAYEARHPGRKAKSHTRIRYGPEWVKTVEMLQTLRREINGRKKEIKRRELEGRVVENANRIAERESGPDRG